MRGARVPAGCVLAAFLAGGAGAVRAADAGEENWSFSAYGYGYIVPDDEDYVQPTIAADHGPVHIEMRYNYEDRSTGSAWMGYNLGFGEKVTFEFTPIVGGVFGATNGMALGYKGTLGWRKLELYSEAEYVFDAGGSAESFFYTWSELSYAPAEWFRFGLVAQKTKVYKTAFDIQRGLLVGFSSKQVDFTAYAFNPDASRPVVVLSIGGRF